MNPDPSPNPNRNNPSNLLDTIILLDTTFGLGAGLRIESFAIIYLRGVSTKLN